MSTRKLLSALVLPGFLLAAFAGPAAAASAKAQCIRSRCNAQSKACLQSYQAQFQGLKAACSDRACRKIAGSFGRSNKQRCKQAGKACKQCCKADPTAACNVEVAGDGLCRGVPQLAEQCDGADAALCPGQCSATCSCSTTNPGGPAGSQVGEVSAAHAVLAQLNAPPNGRDSFQKGEGVFILATFGAGTGGTTPQRQRIGPCDITTITGNEVSPTFTPLDAGMPGTASVGAVSTDLVPNGDPGALGPVTSGLTLFEQGFVPGAQVDFGFPGGADIGAFAMSVQIPAALGLTTPNILDSSLRLDFTQALDLAWSPGNPADSIDVVITATSETTSVVAACKLPDTGSGSLPIEAMTQLPAAAKIIFFSVLRARGRAVTVPLTGGGTGTLAAASSSLAAWAFSSVSGPIRR